MTPEQYERIERLFEQAVALPAADRAAFLDGHCADDAEVRRKLAAMLARGDQTTVNLDQPVREGGLDLDKVVAGALPPLVGRYRILRRIGQGGMGTVYEAEQENPKRRVALKVINPGVVSPELLRRFEFEAQILGRLQHPGIAQIFEAGTFDQGAGQQPFFAMEYVDGEPLLRHVKSSGAGNRARLDLLARICDAVQHAHQRGVIHRDLKPGNILVDASGQPKVLDFGVARATDADVQAATLRTDIGQLVGTIPYMSPEQASGDPDELDTRSDVYALGVVAYELLTDRLPYDIGRKMIHEAVRVIREEDPTPLSSVNRVFRGDVEIIVGKALAKEKHRRYQSAGDLGSDIRRYLSNEPIEARPPSPGYQLGKFARRNKALVSGAAAVFVVLVAGLVGISFALARAVRAEGAARANLVEAQKARAAERGQRLIAESNEKKALTEAAKAQQVADFTQDMLSGIDPVSAGDMDKSLMRLVLDKAATRIETDLADQPEVEASIRQTIGLSYQAIGVYESAEPHTRRARELRSAVLGDEATETLRSANTHAVLLWRLGRYDEAEATLVRTLEARRRILGEDHLETLRTKISLALLYQSQGRHGEAEPLYTEALETQRAVLGDEATETLRTMSNLAILFELQGRYDEAESIQLRTLEVRRRTLGEDHPDTLNSRGGLAVLYQALGRIEEAGPLLARLLESQRRVLGDEHAETLATIMNLAIVQASLGRVEDAESLFTVAMETQQRVLGHDHPETLNTMNNLAILYDTQGRLDDAERLYDATLEARRRTLGDEHPDTLLSMSNLADVYGRQGRAESARPLVRALVSTMRRIAESNDATADTKNQGAWLLLTCQSADLREPENALALALAACDMTGNEDPNCLDTLSLALHMTGDTEKAVENQRRAIALLPPGASELRAGMESALATFEAAMDAGTDTDADPLTPLS